MVSKLKGKEWFEITAPKFFGDFVIGETIAFDPSQLKGRIIETSLTDITGDPNKYYLKFFFKIESVDGKKAITFKNRWSSKFEVALVLMNRV